MADYLDDIVQNIVTKCDLSDLHLLMDNVDELSKKARKLGNAFSKALTGEEQIAIAQANAQIAKSNEIISWNNSLKEKSAEITSWNNVLRAKENRLRAENNNQTKIATQERDKQISREKLQLQLSKERTAQMRKETSEMRRQSALLRNLSRLFFTYFGIRTLKSMFDTASRIQLVQKSIQGLTKSTQDWDYIQKQAFEKGIDLEVVAKGYRNFYSSAKMAGFDKGGIQQMYSDMLLSTRAIGASTQQTEGALLALEQMLSKGRVSMEELRRQMGNAIPGAFEIGARAMNMTTAEFNNFVQKVGIASSEFVPKFIKQLKEEYAGGFKGISETLSFATTRLSVAWKLFQLELFEGETGKSFARMIDSLAKLMVSPEFKQFAKNLGQILELIVKILSFAISHIRTILVLIGTGGIMAVLPQIVKYLQMIGLGIGFITSAGVLNGIRVLVGSFWAMFAPMAALYGKILLVVSALIILKDVYDAIVHPDWDSLTRREWEGKNTTFGASQSGLNPFGTPQTVKQKMQEYEKLRTRPMEMYSSPSAGILNGGLFNKSETKGVNISLGDINVNSNNGNPLQIAQAVQEQLIALFTGRGLIINAQETVV